jgi:carbamoyl-phosphate synthase small subunit
MNAYLLLANGMVFAGQSVGAEGVTVGEVVFATGMVGFEETLTDPSYYGQIITQTYPLIGNYGMNKDDMESDRIWAKGYIVREACTTPSNWRCEETLDSFLKKNNTIGIEGIDTRHLTRIIRESGVMNGAILTTFDPADPANKAETEKLLETIRAYAVTDAVKSVTCEKPEVFHEKGETHIVLMHYGCKRNIVRCLVKRGCKVTVMPAFATAEEVAALNPDGIMLSNGPGDPAENVEIIANLQEICKLGIPLFGICLGHQLLALAHGFRTEKLKYGHRGANQPVKNLETGRVYISSQNHGYAVVSSSIDSAVARELFVNVNDNTCEGIRYLDCPAFSVQFHPEACGGPLDTQALFDEFFAMMKEGE